MLIGEQCPESGLRTAGALGLSSAMLVGRAPRSGLARLATPTQTAERGSQRTRKYSLERKDGLVMQRQMGRRKYHITFTCDNLEWVEWCDRRSLVWGLEHHRFSKLLCELPSSRLLVGLAVAATSPVHVLAWPVGAPHVMMDAAGIPSSRPLYVRRALVVGRDEPLAAVCCLPRQSPVVDKWRA
ncbi:uncharacterized protein SPSK_10475 [Sporothrix schenckii 1099-18]|uniref:Uncharacterized protein n=1 Tax=Sporothrix schenckii 1099-18 TaxID=1397361 RepID=A0A0F2MD73_SPOSC|nr:uncharacterized protein SPSK_10475 [Sporothrix schenckii 1099-18]KJR86091.1 hypothetical protein SPSK_10475 [Sporothrix schenckii 1099-18]